MGRRRILQRVFLFCALFFVFCGTRRFFCENSNSGCVWLCFLKGSKTRFLQFVPFWEEAWSLPRNLTSGWLDVYQGYTFLALEVETQKFEKKSNRSQSGCCYSQNSFLNFFLPFICARLQSLMIKFSINHTSRFSDARSLLFGWRRQSRPLAHTSLLFDH